MLRRAGKTLDSVFGNLSEKFQREMKLVAAGPAGADAWEPAFQSTDVLVRLFANPLRQFNRAERTPEFGWFRHAIFPDAFKAPEEPHVYR